MNKERELLIHVSSGKSVTQTFRPNSLLTFGAILEIIPQVYEQLIVEM